MDNGNTFSGTPHLYCFWCSDQTSLQGLSGQRTLLQGLGGGPLSPCGGAADLDRCAYSQACQ